MYMKRVYALPAMLLPALITKFFAFPACAGVDIGVSVR